MRRTVGRAAEAQADSTTDLPELTGLAAGARRETRGMADDRPVTDDRHPADVVCGMVDHVLALVDTLAGLGRRPTRRRRPRLHAPQGRAARRRPHGRPPGRGRGPPRRRADDPRPLARVGDHHRVRSRAVRGRGPRRGAQPAGAAGARVARAAAVARRRAPRPAGGRRVDDPRGGVPPRRVRRTTPTPSATSAAERGDDLGEPGERLGATSARGSSRSSCRPPPRRRPGSGRRGPRSTARPPSTAR